jgi:hypothetical protein
MSKLKLNPRLDRVFRFIDRERYPLIFLLVCILSYGLFLPFMGFYLDDWYLVWFKHVFGALDYVKYFSSDRPLMGYFYIAANFILGGSESPLVWQIFGVLTRWLSVVALWQMLNTIWPAARRQNIYVALLAAVYPGFTQQWIAAIYSFFFTCLAGFFFSITLMLKGIRSPRRSGWYYLGSVLLMAYVIPASEFFFGLEFIRLLVLWFEFRKAGTKFLGSLKRTALYGFPYVVILALFWAWRALFFTSVNHAMDVRVWLAGGINQAIVNTLNYIYQAIVTATVHTWVNLINIDNYPSSLVQAAAVVGMMIVAFGVLLVWLRKIRPGEGEQIDVWQKQAPALALVSLVLAVLPFWSANLPIDYRFPFDRFLLAFLMGACLLMVWLFEGLRFYSRKLIFLVVALLVSVSIGYQVANANRYRITWELQKQFLWQLDWRIPALQPNTMLLSYQLPETESFTLSPYQLRTTELWTGDALSAFLNWTYAGSIVNRRIPYYYLIINSGQSLKIPFLKPAQPVLSDFRTYSFEGNTSQSVYIYYPFYGCLRVLDSELTPLNTVMDLIPQQRLEDTQNAANLTNLDLITSGNGGHPPLQVLGSEPAKAWCYYFEKAEFARQLQDYGQVVSLYTEAVNNRLVPLQPTELYPFIDAFARTGDWAAAEKITTGLLPAKGPALKTGLCHVWSTLASSFPEQPVAARLMDEMSCR